MQNDLIMNHLPLPKYFDGYQWNTKLCSNRKSIPKYLHEDLPQLKHLYIKQIFKNLGKLNCPNIQFFNKMIKKKQKKQKKYQQISQQDDNINNNKKYCSYNQIKQQLQYALLTTDKSSNIIDQLVGKAQSVNKKNHNYKTQLLFYNSNNNNNNNSINKDNNNNSINKSNNNNNSINKSNNNKNSINKNKNTHNQHDKSIDKSNQTSNKMSKNSAQIKSSIKIQSQPVIVIQSQMTKKSMTSKSFRSKSFNSKNKRQQLKTKYFQNTVDLVFRNRRNKFLQNLKNPITPDQIPQNFIKRFNQLNLIDIKNQHIQ